MTRFDSRQTREDGSELLAAGQFVSRGREVERVSEGSRVSQLASTALVAILPGGSARLRGWFRAPCPGDHATRFRADFPKTAGNGQSVTQIIVVKPWHIICKAILPYDQLHQKHYDQTMTTLSIIKCLLPAIAIGGLNLTASAITKAEADTILFMKQEEKVARDAYQVLGAKWGVGIFANIAVSEQRHMDAVDRLISRYRLRDTAPAQVGIFTIPELQKLYDDLVAFGSESLENALLVGKLIEETDIEDLAAAIAATREPAIRNVFSNLLAGSENHLAAFTQALEP